MSTPDNVQRLELRQRSLALVAKGIGAAAALSTLSERDALVADILGARSPLVATVQKAAVEALSLQGPVSGASLTSLQSLSSGYVAREQPHNPLATPGFRRVPMNTLVSTVTSGTSATWNGTSQPTLVQKMAFDRSTLGTTSLSVISVLTDELARFASPEALGVVETDLITATGHAIGDEAFSSKPAIDGLQPAGLLAGKSPVGGGSPDSAESDVLALITAVRSGEAETPVFFASRYGAATLVQQRTSTGQRLFPNVGLNGGDIYGVPLVVTRSAESKLILADVSTILVADGGADIDRAEAGALQLSDAPSAGGTAAVSLFQTNSIALRVRRWINWQAAYSDSIAYIDIVGAGSPS